MILDNKGMLSVEKKSHLKWELFDIFPYCYTYVCIGGLLYDDFFFIIKLKYF